MIDFEEMGPRLKAMDLDRSWLAANTPYKLRYINDVLAANSTRRTERVQQILSDAIEREESRRASMSERILPDRIGLEVSATEFEAYNLAALKRGLTLKNWAITTLNEAAGLSNGGSDSAKKG